MEHYTYRSREPFTEDRGKCMVDPDHLGGFNVRPLCFRMHRLVHDTHLCETSILMGNQGKCRVDPDRLGGSVLSCHIPGQICMCGSLPRQSYKRGGRVRRRPAPRYRCQDKAFQMFCCAMQLVVLPCCDRKGTGRL